MSLAVLRSRALSGMDAPQVTVEVHLANGLPGFTIVGLPEAEVKEAKDRVRAALLNNCFEFPNRRIVVNLAPADLPKESGRFDLPIALGILAASGQIPDEDLDRYEYAGELSLSGALRPIRGALAMAYAIQGLPGPRGFILPLDNADEAALVRDAGIYPAGSLLEVCAHFAAPEQDADARLARHAAPAIAAIAAAETAADGQYPDFSDVKGQLQVKRALEIAAAGRHSILMVGPPGAGKSMLAARLPGILPPMTEQQALESAALQSISGKFTLTRWKRRPYRAPHHTASAAALVGGGGVPRPGEISLAHQGVLFLDELPEFDRHVLEVLREPLESGHITISRAAAQAEFPAGFQLIAAMNPCPCGYFGHAAGGVDNACRCTPTAISRYQGKISGPLLDRIDMQIPVTALQHAELTQSPAGEASAAIAARVALAFERQLQRQNHPNNLLTPRGIEAHCTPDQAGAQLLGNAMKRLNWSARAYHRVLKLARTIADLDQAAVIAARHIAEAVQLRRALREP
ncbi:ATP-binding protein [Oxalobacteraceae bacterium CAVE-383]|nr:ATP-binding protein [Oxalobacteraceae bacterium CAVE-383]